MKAYSLSFDRLPPVPWTRVRNLGKRRFNDSKYSDYKQALANTIRGRFPLEIGKVPKIGESGRQKHLAQVKYILLQQTFVARDTGDDDNYRKTLADALQLSGLVADDKQIRGGQSFTRIDAKRPRILFTLVEVPVHMLDDIAISSYESMIEELKEWMPDP